MPLSADWRSDSAIRQSAAVGQSAVDRYRRDDVTTTVGAGWLNRLQHLRLHLSIVFISSFFLRVEYIELCFVHCILFLVHIILSLLTMTLLVA